MKELLCQMTLMYADRPTSTVTLKMPVDLLDQVKKAAALEGTEYEAIINCYIHQGLDNSKAEIKRLQFAEHAQQILKDHGIKDQTIGEIVGKFAY